MYQVGAASGFSSTTPGSVLGSTSNLGTGGTWVVDNTVASALRIHNTDNTGAPSAGITANFTGVHNPSASNSTFYIKISTFSNDDWTGLIDEGYVATSTAGQVTVSADVNETLTFTLASTAVDLGTLTSSTTGTGTSAMSVATNATTGYSVTYSGSTLTSGTNTITAMTARALSDDGNKQFGINMRDNVTPNIGADVTGGGTGGTVAADYNVVGEFKFLAAGEQIASSTLPTNSNTFTTSYIANIDDITAAGIYTTVITYVATANF